MTRTTDLVNLNNKRREQLHPENLNYYEEMLVYLRLGTARSERQTEELLLELLEHLLQAQKEGRTAQEVFGENPKSYCDELIVEIPAKPRKQQLRFAARMILIFLSSSSIAAGIAGYGLFQWFGLGTGQTDFYLGSALAIVLVDLLLLWVVVTSILRWMRGSAFESGGGGGGGGGKNSWNIRGYLKVMVMIVLSMTSAVLLMKYMPAFGKLVSIPTLSLAGVGILLYLISLVLKRAEKLAEA
ncbi:DUF1129 family protein [Paenibacillus donghaensis]|uniref:DUF1129 domain-containing protein n=1 Tax=Paenibacillus donghaensis TaxID=414771 RepID=A0A2Z2KF87_9BACL|nr:DUF1129 family protein [Paenibacillus donghaensis]ASA21783.1 hypothetical protein B9T62_13990 [Paenibacillus donghaensis]